MYVCICKPVTDHQIRKAVFNHDVSNMRQLRTCLGACEQCGKCGTEAKRVLTEAMKERAMLEQHGVTC
jgi:bacterioferritin-associated ferredoxin